ncbi:hypothetical protein FHR25_005161 [Yokenella regensburgei]|nr:hypothetical protein FHR25_005161 [Yokenella regensburgei]
MTDTAGTSDIIFGLFWLLGYQFSPRLADAGEAVFWRIYKNAHYGALDELARGCVKLSPLNATEPLIGGITQPVTDCHRLNNFIYWRPKKQTAYLLLTLITNATEPKLIL